LRGTRLARASTAAAASTAPPPVAGIGPRSSPDPSPPPGLSVPPDSGAGSNVAVSVQVPARVSSKLALVSVHSSVNDAPQSQRSAPDPGQNEVTVTVDGPSVLRVAT